MHFDEAVLAVFIIHYGAFWKLFWFRNFAKKERNGKNLVMHCLLSNNEITIKKQTLWSAFLNALRFNAKFYWGIAEHVRHVGC